MAQNAPGQHYHKGITLADLFKMFPDDATAEKWFIRTRWPDGIQCPYCNSNNIKDNASHATMPFRCNDCKKRFSVKSKSIMHSSKLGYQTWAIALYLVTTNLKGVSSMKLHRDLGITQKTAWHLLHRIRKAYETTNTMFGGEIEVDETYVGGKEGNKHAKDKLHSGRGTVGKTAVVGMKERDSKRIRAKVIDATDKATLQGFVIDNTDEDSIIDTDEALAYRGMPKRHAPVKHSVGEYVREQAHTNGMESFSSMLTHGFTGTYHRMSPKHLHRYINEFEGRHNDRTLDTEVQMANVVRGADSKRLRYADLIA